MPPQPISAPAVTEPLGLATAVGAGIIDTSTGDPLDPPTTEAPNGHWLQGYALVGEVCGLHKTFLVNPACGVVDYPPRQADPDNGWDGYTGLEAAVPGFPFVVGAGVTCSTFGSPGNLDFWHARANRRLDLCRWSELADELWTGGKAKLDGLSNRYLASPDATLVNGGVALSVIGGIAEMDASFRQCSCGGPRVIHAPVEAIDWMKARNVIVAQGMRWYTAAGNEVVFDDGYPGSGPDTAVYDPDNPGDELRAAPALGTFWIYGTSPVVVKWGPRWNPEIALQDAVTSTENVWLVTAMQYAMASWMCCHFAALIDTSIAN